MIISSLQIKILPIFISYSYTKNKKLKYFSYILYYLKNICVTTNFRQYILDVYLYVFYILAPTLTTNCILINNIDRILLVD